MHVALIGATGTIGQATARALVAAGHMVTAPVRDTSRLLVSGVTSVSASDADWGNCPIDAVISCMASRSGTPRDAWAVDHNAQMEVLTKARRAGVRKFVLLSAICVQKPMLAFQQAKLAFEAQLTSSDLDWSIVRPTAFFKSLSGQIARVQSGKPFLLFGDGLVTACKPISDRDLAAFIVQCLDDPSLSRQILPIGGPGPAITPREQGERLFEMLNRPVRFKHVPLTLMDGIVAGLSLAGKVSTRLADKAQLARIGRYYATESMLVWDDQAGRYDPDATPETGQDTLWDHYAALLRGDTQTDLGAHAVF